MKLSERALYGSCLLADGEFIRELTLAPGARCDWWVKPEQDRRRGLHWHCPFCRHSRIGRKQPACPLLCK